MSSAENEPLLTDEQRRQRAVLYPPAFKESDLRDYLKSEYALYEATLSRLPEYQGPPLPSLREIRKQFGGGYARIQRIKRKVEVELGLREPDDEKPQRRRSSSVDAGESMSVETDRRLARIEEALGDVRKEQKKVRSREAGKKPATEPPEIENLRVELERISRKLQALAEAVNSQVRQTGNGSSSALNKDDVQDLSDLCHQIIGRVEGLSQQTRERHVSWEAAGEQVLQAAAEIQLAKQQPVPQHIQPLNQLGQQPLKFMEGATQAVAPRLENAKTTATIDDPTLHVLAGIAHLRAEETEAKVLACLRQIEQRIDNRPVTLDDYSLAVIAGMLVLRKLD